jgi:integrase
LLGAFASKRLDQITVEDVDRYRLSRQGKLSANAINKTLSTLSAILELAVEYGSVERNVAHGKRRRLPSSRARRSWLDRARLEPARVALVFGTSTGNREGATNVRRRVLAKAVKLANRQLAKNGQGQLPAKLTPHDLRRTFASLLFAVGETRPYVMAQMGHTTASLTLAIYARQMDRRDGELERLKALVEGREWTAMDSSVTKTAADAKSPAGAPVEENPTSSED